jgi:hypothetical protein
MSGRPLGSAQVESFGAEVGNLDDSGARWCSIVLLGRTLIEDRQDARNALGAALTTEASRENLRAIGYALAGIDPVAA